MQNQGSSDGLTKEQIFGEGSASKYGSPSKPDRPEPPDEAAYHGLAGEIVRTIEPHSEADPAGLLVQLLVAFGNIIGRSAHSIAEADEHYTNLFAVLVGRTSKARKGSSWGHIVRLFSMVEPAWAMSQTKTGLSSGEGLISAVRDPILKIGDDGTATTVEEGVSDKRLLAYEPEFSRTLKVIRRETSTLSDISRDAWDSRGILRTMTRNSPLIATGAHISIIGHITQDELLRRLTETEMANGFGNRFLWAYVDRSKKLPHGGRISQVDFAPLVERLKKALEFSKNVGEMKRDEKATELWEAVYDQLSEGIPGLYGAMIARGEAQTMRLSNLYALLDETSTVRAEHLKAALALWEFFERSCKHIFGDNLGDPTADTINRALQRTPGGLDKTSIHKLFGRNKPVGEIDRALGVLLEHGRARPETRNTLGRQAEHWVASR